MIYKLLPEFFNNSYFNQGSITIYSKNFAYDKGHPVNSTSVSEVINTKKVLVPLNVKDLQDLGLGEYVANESFSLFTDRELRFSSGSLLQKGDLIGYDGKLFKIIALLNYKTHGFYHYTITKFESEVLND
jgi:hypothetical protein